MHEVAHFGHLSQRLAGGLSRGFSRAVAAPILLGVYARRWKVTVTRVGSHSSISWESNPHEELFWTGPIRKRLLVGEQCDTFVNDSGVFLVRRAICLRVKRLHGRFRRLEVSTFGGVGGRIERRGIERNKFAFWN